MMTTEPGSMVMNKLSRHCAENGVFSEHWSEGVLSQPVLDHYRCPEDTLDFTLSGPLSERARYFAFGPNITCYGRSVAAGIQQQTPSYDTSADASLDGGRVSLPFDPSEVVTNLRLERYLRHGQLETVVERLLRRVYYRIRPLMLPSFRRTVQRFHARNWEQTRFPRWPVDTTVESLCETLMLLSMRAKGVDRVPFIWFWPAGASGCVTMTHDVETEAGRDFCSHLMDIDEAFGIRAAFQIVPEQRYCVPATFLESIRSRGFEIGVQELNHDGRLFDSCEEFERR